jgi:glucosamine-6-phosphate deaminase
VIVLKTVIDEKSKLEDMMVKQVESLLEVKPQAVIALTAGRTTEGLYGKLARLCQEGRLSFAKAKIFLVTEYVGGEYEDSCEALLRKQLIDSLDLDKNNFFVPDGDKTEDYDRLIQEAGGIDLCILGLGINAHIGYNEPATPFESYTHVQKLTDATHRQYEGTDRKLTEYAVTMGIKDIVSSRSCLILATGGEKADAVFKMIYGKTITYIPASFLQIPLEVTAYIDRAAAEKL